MNPADGLHPALRYHLVNTLGWPDLRQAQKDAIEPILAGENALILAPTAGGKTEAAVLPLLSRAAADAWRGLSIIYVCPLKALLNNLEPRLRLYASFLGMRAAVWHGDVGASERRRILGDPPHLLLTTPESIEAILISARVDHGRLLQGVRAVVVDELHAFAGDDRGWHLKFLLGRLDRLVGRPIQRIGLSATVGDPQELIAWLAPDGARRIVGAHGSPADGDVTIDFVGSVGNAVTVLSRLHRGERRLVFADSRARVEEIATGLHAAGVRTFVSHASLSADERRRAEAAFASEPDCAIVATSTLELGIDVGDLDRVLQVGAPGSVSSFLQRMGRSGRRAGCRRNFTLLATDERELLSALALALLWRDGFVETVRPPDVPAHIFAQQTLALALQERGIARTDLDGWLGRALDAVPREARSSAIAHMLETDVLHEDAGVLGLGVRGERLFGRRHFSDLVVSFSSPLALTVRHAGVELGTVDPTSLSDLEDGRACILLLGGRHWRVEHVDWARRGVAVIPAPEGGRTHWLGTGRGISASLARAQERILTGASPNCELSRRAQAKLSEMREDFAFLDGVSFPLVRGPGTVTAWTFSGSRAGAAIAGALRRAGLKVSSVDDLSLTVRAESAERVATALAATDPTTIRPDIPTAIAGALKFGECLSAAWVELILTARLSDADAVSQLLGRPRKIVHVDDGRLG